MTRILEIQIFITLLSRLSLSNRCF